MKIPDPIAGSRGTVPDVTFRPSSLETPPPSIAAAPFLAIEKGGAAISKIGEDLADKLQQVERNKRVTQISLDLSDKISALNDTLARNPSPSAHEALWRSGFEKIAQGARDAANDDQGVSMAVERLLAEKGAHGITEARITQRKLQVDDAHSTRLLQMDAYERQAPTASWLDLNAGVKDVAAMIEGDVATGLVDKDVAAKNFLEHRNRVYLSRANTMSITDPDRFLEEYHQGLYGNYLGAHGATVEHQAYTAKREQEADAERKLKIDQSLNSSELRYQILYGAIPPSRVEIHDMAQKRYIGETDEGQLLGFLEHRMAGGGPGDPASFQQLYNLMGLNPSAVTKRQVDSHPTMSMIEKGKLLDRLNVLQRAQKEDSPYSGHEYSRANSIIHIAAGSDGLNPLDRKDADWLIGASKELDRLADSKTTKPGDILTRAYQLAEGHRAPRVAARLPEGVKPPFSSEQELLDQYNLWRNPDTRASVKFSNPDGLNADWWARWRAWYLEHGAVRSGQDLAREKKERGM